MNPSRPEPGCSPPAALAILESSFVVRLGGRVITAISQASGQSALLAPARTARAAWQAQPVAIKQRALGIALIAAAATYGALATWKQDPPGWVWMIVPGLAMAIGLVLIAASPGGRQEQQ